jgi:hypothetical protein
MNLRRQKVKHFVGILWETTESLGILQLRQLEFVVIPSYAFCCDPELKQ